MPEKLPQHPARPEMKFHGTSPRGLETVPRSVSHEGRFGRMFRALAPFEPKDDDLALLGRTMIEKPVDVEDPKAPSNNGGLPAGYTYFGQFIDHDITFDPVSQLQRQNDPDALEDFRTPRFDLDNLYGRGPNDSPFLYDRGGKTFLIGKNSAGEDDLPRANAGDPKPGAWKRALLGDPRNDENLIVSQIHLAFLKYHNKIVKEGNSFEQAQQIVRRHYNWLVLHDFLPRIVGQNLVDSVLTSEKYGDGFSGRTWKADLRFYRFKVLPFMPVEFSVGAYRFGHSMVRFNYALNTATDAHELLIFDPADPDNELADDLRGFRERPANRQIEWSRFFDMAGDKSKLQPARAIDTQISAGLGGLPTVVIGGPASAANPSSLAERNLLRGKALLLPTGQDVARAMGLPDKLILSTDKANNQFSIGVDKPDESSPDIGSEDKKRLMQLFGNATPLWYYILKEAEVFCHGRTLGPVGGRIVAEVFIGLFLADATCFLNVEPNWKPAADKFGCVEKGKFTIADLLTFVSN